MYIHEHKCVYTIHSHVKFSETLPSLVKFTYISIHYIHIYVYMHVYT